MVKIIIFSILTLVTFQKGHAQKYSTKKINSAALNIYKINDNSIYSLNKTELKIILNSSTTNHTLIVFYAFWCGACQVELPTILKYATQNKKTLSIKLINIEKDNSNRQFETKKYLEQINFPMPSFMISEEYGRGKRTKYRNFLKDLLFVKKVPEKYLGLGECILFEGDRIVYLSTYDENITTILNNINNLIFKQ